MKTARLTPVLLCLIAIAILACQSQPLSKDRSQGAGNNSSADNNKNADKLLIVDCLLPGQVRKLGTSMTYLTPRHPVRTSALDCEIRGGEYVAFDRADYRTALNVWLETALKGDAESQVNVGEIFEKGLGTVPNYSLAFEWYRKAAQQGNTRGAINLGYLYEKGLGVEKNTAEALNWYRKASGLDGDDLQFASTIESETEQRVEKLNTEIAGLRNKLQETEKTLKEKQAILSKQERQTLQTAANTYRQELGKLQGPSIELLDPPLSLTRGIPSVKLRSAIKERIIVGKVIAAAGLASLTVNNRPESVDNSGIFQVPVQIKNTTTPVSVVAIDKLDQRAALNFQLVPHTTIATVPTPPPEPSTPRAVTNSTGIEFGNYHALIIGNNQYTSYPQLETAINDAKMVEKLLKEKYGFKTTLLLNADRYSILSTLSELRKQLTSSDNLIIYYAGHGELDNSNERGHWLPVDAEPNNPANWISNTDITDIINTMAAKHVMVVADSCYSGALTRSSLARLAPDLPDNLRTRWYKVMAATRSRTALTSGGLEPVLDTGSGDHSIFAKAFLDTLQNNNTILEAYTIFRHVSNKVVKDAAKMRIEQTPQYAPIRHSGHESGEFLFVPVGLRQQS
ncbi:MAG TPA: caspase family protein [Gammaproteobacteria bacterium]